MRKEKEKLLVWLKDYIAANIVKAEEEIRENKMFGRKIRFWKKN